MRACAYPGLPLHARNDSGACLQAVEAHKGAKRAPELPTEDVGFNLVQERRLAAALAIKNARRRPGVWPRVPSVCIVSSRGHVGSLGNDSRPRL